MKKKDSTWFATLLGFACLAGLGYAFWRLVAFFISILHTLTPELAGPSVAAIIAIIGSVLAVTIGKYLEKKMEVEAAFRERRLKTYETFITTFQSMSEKKSEDLTTFLKKTNAEMILWAGPDLLKAYIKFFRQSAIDSQSGRMLTLLEEFFKAIRSDLGHSNTGLNRGDILSLVIKVNEVDEFLQKIAKEPDYKLGSKS